MVGVALNDLVDCCINGDGLFSNPGQMMVIEERTDDYNHEVAVFELRPEHANGKNPLFDYHLVQFEAEHLEVLIDAIATRMLSAGFQPEDNEDYLLLCETYSRFLPNYLEEVIENGGFFRKPGVWFLSEDTNDMACLFYVTEYLAEKLEMPEPEPDEEQGLITNRRDMQNFLKDLGIYFERKGQDPKQSLDYIFVQQTLSQYEAELENAMILRASSDLSEPEGPL